MKQTLTTERLHEIASGDAFICTQDDESVAMARELLANREAQPVVSICEDELNAALQLHRLKVEGHSQLSDAFRVGFKYARRTAPPAPAVPDFGALTKLIVGRLIDCGAAGDDSIADAETFVYNACRAAILNHSEVALDMVEPSPAMQDGWIACSERMPDDGENIITLNSSGGVFGGYVFKHGVFVDAEEEYRQDDTITHWMPLPAAPEVDKNA